MAKWDHFSYLFFSDALEIFQVNRSKGQVQWGEHLVCNWAGIGASSDEERDFCLSICINRGKTTGGKLERSLDFELEKPKVFIQNTYHHERGIARAVYLVYAYSQSSSKKRQLNEMEICRIFGLYILLHFLPFVVTQRSTSWHETETNLSLFKVRLSWFNTLPFKVTWLTFNNSEHQRRFSIWASQPQNK